MNPYQPLRIVCSAIDSDSSDDIAEAPQQVTLCGRHYQLTRLECVCLL